MKKVPLTLTAVLVVVSLALILPGARPARAQEGLPVYLRDRGTGVPTSMFGTYVRKGEWLVYPFVEYYINADEEYSPEELGYEGITDYRGEFEAYEGLIFISYGITDDLAVEFETGVIDATQKKDPDDPSDVPDEIHESGLSDVEGQIRWRLMRETESRPEVFTYFEIVFPAQKDKHIIGTQDWEFALAVGVTKGFNWGTLTFRTAGAYVAEESKYEYGEYAFEYLKRLSPVLRGYLAVEGEEDEIECIPELQWTFYPNMTLKLNSAFGLTSKAQDWAPEIGVVFSF